MCMTALVYTVHACACTYILCERFKFYGCPYINGMKYIAMQLLCLYILKCVLGNVKRSTAKRTRVEW